jgi:hypothetical protein
MLDALHKQQNAQSETSFVIIRLFFQMLDEILFAVFQFPGDQILFHERTFACRLGLCPEGIFPA